MSSANLTENLTDLQPEKPSPGRFRKTVLAWLDLLAVFSWGAVMLKYWLTRKLYILIHPDYFVLTVVAGGVLLLIALWRFLQLVIRRRDRSIVENAPDHIRLLPAGLSSLFLIVAACSALATTPKVFNSQTAIQRGLGDPVAMTRTTAKAFRLNLNPEERSLIEWVRTINVSPEPDAYVGQKAKVQGLVVYAKTVPEEYLLLTRFVLTCCAADAYPVSIPVKLQFRNLRTNYPADSWVEVQGQMISETLENKRQVVLSAEKITQIPEPANPYEY